MTSENWGRDGKLWSARCQGLPSTETAGQAGAMRGGPALVGRVRWVTAPPALGLCNAPILQSRVMSVLRSLPRSTKGLGGGGWRQLNYPGGQCAGKTGPGLDPDPPALDPATHEWNTGLAASLSTPARALCPGLCLGQKESPASVTPA